MVLLLNFRSTVFWFGIFVRLLLVFVLGFVLF